MEDLLIIDGLQAEIAHALVIIVDEIVLESLGAYLVGDDRRGLVPCDHLVGLLLGDDARPVLVPDLICQGGQCFYLVIVFHGNESCSHVFPHLESSACAYGLLQRRKPHQGCTSVYRMATASWTACRYRCVMFGVMRLPLDSDYDGDRGCR